MVTRFSAIPPRHRMRIVSCAVAIGVFLLTLVSLITYGHTGSGRTSTGAILSTETATGGIRAGVVSGARVAGNRMQTSAAPSFTATKSSASLGPLETIVQTLNNGWNGTKTYLGAIRWEEQQIHASDFQEPVHGSGTTATLMSLSTGRRSVNSRKPERHWPVHPGRGLAPY